MIHLLLARLGQSGLRSLVVEATGLVTCVATVRAFVHCRVPEVAALSTPSLTRAAAAVQQTTPLGVVGVAV